MKIKFIIPGDRLVLNASLPVDQKVGFNRISCFRGITELPSGTVLSVSQIYVRKGGNYDNSVTFHILDCPMKDIIIRNAEDYERRFLQECIDKTTAEINEFHASGKKYKIFKRKEDGTHDIEYSDKNPHNIKGYSLFGMTELPILEGHLEQQRRDMNNLSRKVRMSARSEVVRILLKDLEEVDVDIIYKDDRRS